LLDELYIDIDNQKAKTNFTQAFKLAKTNVDKLALQKKLNKL